jgi:hypothetical protein
MPRFLLYLTVVALGFLELPAVAAVPEENFDVAQAAEPSATPDVDPETGEDDGGVSIGEIPVIETVELTPESARKALDAYVLVREKYKDAELENYESLQEFVDQHAQGKTFEADIKAAGFDNVDAWNTAITTLTFAYSNLLDNQTDEIRQQIEEVKADTDMAQDMKDRMIQSLEATIPSDNNAKIVEDLSKDATYGEKLKSLDVEAE